MCLALLGLSLSACSLIGLEPDEIDVADESGEDTSGQGGDFTGGDAGTDTGATEAGDGDGDTSGDGDGDPGDGDGDGDTSGDGDGDGDGDTTGDGDGDGDLAPCDTFSPSPVSVGSNFINIPEGTSLIEASCGAPGPEAVFVYTAVADGLVQFAFTGDVEAAVYLVEDDCGIGVETLACELAPDPAELLMTQDQTVYVVVDIFSDFGSGNLEILPN